MDGWVTAGANPQRTSWVPDAAPGALEVIWVKPVEPYISQKVQIIAAAGKLFLSTARGLYAFDADTGPIFGCTPPAFRWATRRPMPTGAFTWAAWIGSFMRSTRTPAGASGHFPPAEAFTPARWSWTGWSMPASRDGCMYAVDAATGKAVWQYQTGGQILQSAAYQDGVIYFGSQDAHAYALDAKTGKRVWQSQKLPGMGWHSWWPVIYKDVVMFTRTEVEKGLVGFQNQWLFEKALADRRLANSLPGVRGTEPGDWAEGTRPSISAPTPTAARSRLVRALSLAPQPSRAQSSNRRRSSHFAFGPAGSGSHAPVLPVARAPAGGVVPDPLSEAVLRERLKVEVQKILDAGHLKAGFAKIGLVDFMTVNRLGDHLLHYWHNPAETLTTLLHALPHLPAAMQDKVRLYLKDEYRAFPPYQYVHVGFRDGAPREPFAYPPSTPRIFEHDSGPLSGSSFRGWGKPPHNVYAMWQYARAGLADPATVFKQAAGVIGSTPSDSFLEAFPHVHNAYIAGYVGYVELAKMAGHNEEVQHENGLTPLHQTHALFQAKARILRASRDELAGLLDAPLVPVGDLDYIQNLIATLEAPRGANR